MNTYKYGTYTTWYDVKFYGIFKKTLFGEKEIFWWKHNVSGHQKMIDAVSQLKQKGHLVINK